MADERIKKNETPLQAHKKNNKVLTPPALATGINWTMTSWLNESLPEMLWAVLIIGNLDRAKAIIFFRYIAKFVERNQECWDVTLTGIAKLPAKKRKLFLEYFASHSKETRDTLRPLLLLPGLPGYDNWKEAFPAPTIEDDWQKLMIGVEVTLWHQSQEATDCRWIKYFCTILGGKTKFVRSFPNIQETLKGIFEYPNYGDLEHISSFIRASESARSARPGNTPSEWSKLFWEYCFENTSCYPEVVANDEYQKLEKNLGDEINILREYYLEETSKIRNKLIDHFFISAKTSAVDSRHEAAFGLTLYSVSILLEYILHQTSLSITARLGLRTLVESYITFSYLLMKEKEYPRVWDEYRSYGTGKMKHIYLKFKESGENVDFIALEKMDLIANEDKWAGFVSINLGHWDSTNLRKMAEGVNLMDIYDKYYDYTSGFLHCNWGAIRDSVYQKCINPLHRGHRIPVFDVPLMPSVTLDAIELTNQILGCLAIAYPAFEDRIAKAKQ